MPIRWMRTSSLSCLFLFFVFVAIVTGNDEFDVLTIEDVPFPSSNADNAAAIKIVHNQKISEFTVCYRFLLTSYNDGWTRLIRATSTKYRNFYYEQLSFNTGFESEGYQALS